MPVERQETLAAPAKREGLWLAPGELLYRDGALSEFTLSRAGRWMGLIIPAGSRVKASQVCNRQGLKLCGLRFFEAGDTCVELDEEGAGAQRTSQTNIEGNFIGGELDGYPLAASKLMAACSRGKARVRGGVLAKDAQVRGKALSAGDFFSLERHARRDELAVFFARPTMLHGVLCQEATWRGGQLLQITTAPGNNLAIGGVPVPGGTEVEWVNGKPALKKSARPDPDEVQPLQE